jgi:hypothetical protein
MTIPDLKWPLLGWLIIKTAQIVIEESFPPLRKNEREALGQRAPYVLQGEDLPSRYEGLFARWRQSVRYEYETRVHWETRAAFYEYVVCNIPWVVSASMLDYAYYFNNDLLAKICIIWATCVIAFWIRSMFSAAHVYIKYSKPPQPFKDILLGVIRLGERSLVNLEEQPEIGGKYQRGIVWFHGQAGPVFERIVE